MKERKISIKKILLLFNILLLIIFIILVYLFFSGNIKFSDNSIRSGIINVKSPPYNAKGDGKHDDTKAIQKAINDLVDGGGIIYLPKGSYNISSSLKIKDGITLRGIGSLGTIIRNTGTGYAIESIEKKRSKTSTMVEDKVRRYQTIENITVQGTDNAEGGIKLSFSGEYFEINKVRILGNINGVGLNLQDSYSGIIQNVHVSQSTNNTGIKLQARQVSSGQISFINVVVAHSKYGVEIGESYNTSSAQIIDSVSFTGCIFQHNEKAGLRIGSNVRHIDVRSSHFEWQDEPSAVGLQINGQSAFGGSIVSSWFYKNETAIQIDNAEGYIFESLNIQNGTNGVVTTANASQIHLGKYIRYTNIKNNIVNSAH
ncbi:glycosyl hydrolase family 28-related protein [Peribacillus muralis]|uniref:glycosyl hydrolase family 28-related protein n=1 Tax=Peribacillus muralis TaxID=264697 RepID=UPI00070A1940|nr:glycosyl hydrolase family 28-related protein [Peribacillus muralis]